MAQINRWRWVGLASLALGLAMIITDATIVNVAIPSIIADLQIELTDAEWINTTYSLIFAALLVTVGRLGDLYGRKRLYLLGLITFVAASLLCAAAPSGSWLILARALQGIGASMILPSTLSTVNALFRGRERAIAFGIWGSVIGGTAALGPLVGGWLTTDFSWRWAFWINLPIGLIAGTIALLTVPPTRDESSLRGLDPLGIVLSTIGFAALIYGLIEGERYGWLRPDTPFRLGSWEWPSTTISPVPVALILSAIILPLFILWEQRRLRRRESVLLDLSLFQFRSFRWGNLAALIVSLGEFGMIFVLPLYLQAVLGYTALETGFVLLAVATGAFLGGPAAAQLALRYGAPRVVQAGMVLEALGLFLLIPLLSPTTTGWILAPALFLYGVGVGLATAQLTSIILAEVPASQSGQASGTQSTSRQIGAALGIAILGTFLAAGLSANTETQLQRLSVLPPQQVSQLAKATKQSAGQVLVTLREQPGTQPIVTAIEEAFTSAARRDAGLAGAFILLGFIASWLLPDIRPTERMRQEKLPATQTVHD